jgi:hypothetical protein
MMREGYAFSRKMAALCAASMCTAAAISFVRQNVAHGRIERLRTINDTTNVLTQQILGLSAFSNGELATLHSRVESRETLLGKESTWSELRERIDARWSIETGTRRENGNSTSQTGVLTLKSPKLEDWQTAVDALGSLKLLPGIIIVRFEMRAREDYEHSSVEILKVIVESHTVRASSETSLQ